MHGHEVLARVRNRYRAIPVIVLSAIDDVSTIVASMKLGAWHYVTKPWSNEELIGRLQGAVRERRQQPGVLLVSNDVASLTPLELALEPHERVLATNVDGALRSQFSAKAVVLHVPVPSVVDDVRRLYHRFPAAALVVITDLAHSRLLEHVAGIPIASIVETPFEAVLRDLLRFGVVKGATSPPKVVDTAIRFIVRRYGSRITVADVAHAASLSEDRLAHVFRDATGLSVKDYIIRFRVAIGRRLLTETPEKVEAISGHIGFADRSNFSRAFKQVDGRTPGEFRRAQSQMLN
jgi:YesN/AraC family two-component response regulator